MDQVPSVQSDLFRGAISPTRETRTLAVREFEATIAELKKENFDLKLQFYLRDKSSSKNLKKDGDEETVTVQIVVDLQVENESLKNELRSKDQLLQEALTQSENHASHVKELQETLVEVQEKLSSIENIPLEWQQFKEDKDIFEKENEYFKSILPEKDAVIQNANAQIEELSSQIEVLEAKLAKRRTALQGIVYKYHTDIEKIPKELRPIVQRAVQAAKECKKDELNSAIVELKSSLSKLMPTSSQEVSYGLQHQDESETMVSDEPTKLLVGQSTESINESEKSYGSENYEDMATFMKDNEQLKSDNDEKARTIQSLNATCSELERRNIQLSSDLSEAISKVRLLETKVNEEMGQDDDLERKYLEDCLAHSNQVNHELLGLLRELETFMEDLLQHRNLDSSSIAETTEVLSRLTSFLDDTRKLSIALSEQISIHESSKLFHPNDVSTKREDYSQTEEQSNQEVQSNRSLDNPNAYSIPKGKEPFSQLESHTNTAGTGRRRLSFTTLHNASRMDSEKIVVLGTSNNEDLILLLNEKGDPEDVLIRNNQTEHRNLVDFYGQLPRHCLDSSLGLWHQSSWHASPEKKHLGQEKSSMEQWCASEIPIVGPNRCPSSDSDIWSEPDRDVSLQRIGIDVQKSPVAHKSPRRLRHRTTDESSSQKIESSSSAVKCHPLLKRRRSGGALKSPLVCKKCQSPSKNDLAEKDRLQKVINDLHNKCCNQENKLEETNENLKNKNEKIDALSKENHELSSYINQFQTELEKLRTIDKEVSLGASESTEKLTELYNKNTRLKNYIKLLESKATESESILETSKSGLIETKTSLQNLEEICSDYKRELSTSIKALEEYKQKCDKLEEKLIQKTEEIACLTKENSELISSINELEVESKEWKIKEEQLTLQSSETSGKLTEVNNENVKLKQIIKSLETKGVESNSSLEKLKQELQETRKSLHNLEDICCDYKTKLSTSSKSLEDYIQKNNMLEEKFIQKTRDFDNRNKELLNSINKFQSVVKEMKAKERELTLQTSHSSAKLTEVNNENVKLKNDIMSLESLAIESDSVCNKLKQELEETRKRLQNLDEKCSNYEIKLSASNQISKNLKQKYNDVAKENSKFLNDISELASAKNELIRCLQDEKENVRHILSENSNLKEELEIKSKSLTTLQSQYSKLQISSSKALEERENQLTTSNSISEHQEQAKQYKSQIDGLQQDLRSTQAELAAAKFYMKEMKAYGEHVKQSLDDTDESLRRSKGRLSSSETKLSSMQVQVEEHKKLLDEKNKQISELQNKVAKTENQLADALLEKKRLSSQVKMNTTEQPSETVSELYPSKGSPNVSISSETSITQERSRISPSSSVKVEESDNKSVAGKYIDIIRSLKTKLALAEQRIVILEREKGHLREHLLAQVCKDKSANQSSEDLDNLRKDNADLHDQLQAKSSCIDDLKQELYQTCNSLLSKQKEVDDLKCKLSDSQEQISETKSTNAQEGSQESIFQRSDFSSPDLGIESDPNHESSAPEQSDTKSHEGMWLKSQPLYIDRSTSLQVSDHATTSMDTLHALCVLQHYELLKKEVQESLNSIKSVLSRASDGLQHVSKYTSLRKSLESSTFKAIIDSGGNIVVCLYKARELLEQFRIESCPSKEEFSKLVQKNQEMQEELNACLESRSRQERYFSEAMERLKQAEILQEEMEKKTTKKLVKTKKIIRQAERKLLEQRNNDMPLPKYPADETTCQKMQ